MSMKFIALAILSAGKFAKQHGVLIVVARLGFSCSLFATFGAQDSEEKQILEEINHEDRNPYVGGYIDFGRKYLGESGRNKFFGTWP